MIQRILEKRQRGGKRVLGKRGAKGRKVSVGGGAGWERRGLSV